MRQAERVCCCDLIFKPEISPDTLLLYRVQNNKDTSKMRIERCFFRKIDVF